MHFGGLEVSGPDLTNVAASVHASVRPHEGGDRIAAFPQR
jgi:hypothetical protein